MIQTENINLHQLHLIELLLNIGKVWMIFPDQTLICSGYEWSLDCYLVHISKARELHGRFAISTLVPSESTDLTIFVSFKVVFATPGMLHAGLSLQIFKKWAPDEKNMVTSWRDYCLALSHASSVISLCIVMVFTGGNSWLLRCWNCGAQGVVWAEENWTGQEKCGK